VLVSELGQLFVAMHRTRINNNNGWSGIGFNGESIVSQNPEFVSKSINVYINQTYSDVADGSAA
jgi:hypothetical protein